MIDFSDDEAVHKLVRLIWNLTCWSLRNKVYQSQAPTIPDRYETTYEILGLAGYVTQGYHPIRSSYLVHCANCGRTHKIPIKTTIYISSYCSKCEPDYVDSLCNATLLDNVQTLLMALPPQVEESFLDRLADSYFVKPID